MKPAGADVVKSVRFDAVEGLRAFLALWVVYGHILQLSGFGDVPAPFGILLRADYAVDLFIILSGLVITHLLTEKREAYLPFVTRRFFRLYPAFLVCGFLGFATTGLYLAYVDTAQIPASDFWVQSNVERHARAVAMHDQIVPHILAHLTMLHGAIPKEILPFSAVTFLFPAWSISLEWQFYLLAPLILWALKSRIGTAVLVIVSVAAYALYTAGALGTFTYKAFLPSAAGYFAIGIGSRLLLGRLKGLALDPAVVALVLCGFLWWFVPERIVLTLWSVFFAYLLFPVDRIDGKAFNLLFNNPISQSLGRVSYSLYLVHIPVIVVVGFTVVRLGWAQDQMSVLLWHLIASGLVTVAMSYLLYHAVERPGIRLGNMAAGLYGKTARDPAPAAI